MSYDLLFQLWKSDDGRKAIIGEAVRLVEYIVGYILGVVIVRLYIDRPLFDDLAYYIGIVIAIFIAWGTSLKRTLSGALKNCEKINPN